MTTKVNGWTIRPSSPCVAPKGIKYAAERKGAQTRYYYTLAEAKRACKASTTELTGGLGII